MLSETPSLTLLVMVSHSEGVLFIVPMLPAEIAHVLSSRWGLWQSITSFRTVSPMGLTSCVLLGFE